uniref:Uncharacterized protein n=1 Tax=Globisporangium ultimum (strain ATCC 200006 / CBS 805.95 / DAOM BR144) TaxID=431595 RepID=K3X4K1_GLOUD
MKPGRSFLEFNCIQENTAGKADEIERLLQRVNANYIEHLMIRHCLHLQVQPYLKNLKYLLAMKIFNVSTLEWGEDAALTNSHHPTMQIVYLVEVNMVELPQGLLAADYPQTLHQVMISRANLTFLPDNLDTIWLKGMFLLLEECRLTEFPELPLLILNGNPIQPLLSNLSDNSLSLLGWIQIRSTKISVLPDWLNAVASLYPVYIVTGNTPLCDRMIATGEAAHSLTFGPFGPTGIDCCTSWMESSNAFPIDFEEERNPSYVLA